MSITLCNLIFKSNFYKKKIGVGRYYYIPDSYFIYINKNSSDIRQQIENLLGKLKVFCITTCNVIICCFCYYYYKTKCQMEFNFFFLINIFMLK